MCVVYALYALCVCVRARGALFVWCACERASCVPSCACVRACVRSCVCARVPVELVEHVLRDALLLPAQDQHGPPRKPEPVQRH